MINKVRSRFTFLSLLIIILLLALGALSYLHPASAASSLNVQIKSNGTDNNQQTAFAYVVKNTGTSAVSGVSVRVYFTLDGSNAASNYALEKYYDQSGVATVSTPTLASGSTYYYTINYGTASLAAGAQWEFQTALHLASWGTTFNGGNDHFHTGYAVGALPAAYTNTNYLPAYLSGTLAWGTEPGTVPTNTPTNTLVTPATASTANDAIGPDLVVTSISYAPAVPACSVSQSKNVVVKNQGTASAGTFIVRFTPNGGASLDQTVTGLAAGASITVNFAYGGQGGIVSATADVNNQVSETIENNNSLTAQLPALTPPPTCTPIPGALPDLVVTSIRPGGTAACGSFVDTLVSVANNGTADATGTFVVRYNNIDQTVTGLAASTTITIQFAAGLGATNTATADATNVITESNEVNNTFNMGTTATPTGTPNPLCLTPQPTPTTRPDLIVSSAQIVNPTFNGQCATNTSLVLRVVVKNNGAADARGSILSINSAQYNVAALTVGQSATIDVPPNGPYTIVADSSNRVAESNENNNSLSYAGITATPPVICTGTPTANLPDLIVTSMLPGVPFGAVCQNQRGTAVTVKNNSTVNVGSFVVRFNSTQDQTVSSLAGGATTTLTFSGGGPGLVTAIVDATDLILESNESNNTLSLAIDPAPTTTAPPTCTPSPTPSITCDKPGLSVSGVISPTSLLSQVISASITTGGIPQFTVIARDSAGNQLSSATTDSSDTLSKTMNLSLVANMTHFLTVGVNAEEACRRSDGTIVSTTFVQESKTVDVSGKALVIVQQSGTPSPTPTSTFTPTPSTTPPCTCTCASSCATATAVAAMTQTALAQTRTVTPSPTPTLTRTPSATLTPSKTNTQGSDPCSSPTIITGGGTFAVGTTAKCFKYVNTAFVRGGMFSVMKDGTSTSDTLQWYGGLDQNVTACSNQSSTISGNGGQLNNFTVAKDANGQMFLTITGGVANNVTISITNWQNGNGCSVVPTVHP